MSCFVELVGSPGAGKTTFAAAATAPPWQSRFVGFIESTFRGLCSDLKISPDNARSTKQFNLANEKNDSEYQKRIIDRAFSRSKRGYNRLASSCALYPHFVARACRKLETIKDENRRHTMLRWLLPLGALDPRFLKPDTRIRQLINFFSQHPHHLQKVFQILETTDGFAERKRIIGWLFNLYVRYQYFAYTPPDGRCLLMDEGFIGRVVTLFAYQANQPASEAIRNYVRTAPRPAAVISLRQDVDTCYRRLNSRPSGPPLRFRSLPYERQLQILRASQECIDVALSELATLGVPSIKIDSALEPLEQVRSAVAALDQLMMTKK